MLLFCLISKAGSDIIVGRREQFGTLLGRPSGGYRLSEHHGGEQSVDAYCRLRGYSVELKRSPTWRNVLEARHHSNSRTLQRQSVRC